MTEDRLDRFLHIPDEFHDCDFILTELFHRESGLWDLVPPQPEGYELDKGISSSCGAGSMEDLCRLKKSIEGPIAKRHPTSDASRSVAAIPKKKQRVVRAGQPAVQMAVSQSTIPFLLMHTLTLFLILRSQRSSLAGRQGHIQGARACFY